MKRDIADFVSKCLECQRVKVEHQHPAGLLQLNLIPNWKCDIIVGFHVSSRCHDAIMVIVDRLTKVAHFVPI